MKKKLLLSTFCALVAVFNGSSAQAQANDFLTMCGGGTGTFPGPWIRNGANISYSGGNVGIGTSNPSQALDVNGNINALGYLINGQPLNSAFQARITQSCAAGSSIRAIDQNGNVTCEQDSVGSGDGIGVNIYTNGTFRERVADLNLDTTVKYYNGPSGLRTIGVEQTQVQRRITGSCPSGAISSVSETGTVTCSSGGITIGSLTLVSVTADQANDPACNENTGCTKTANVSGKQFCALKKMHKKIDDNQDADAKNDENMCDIAGTPGGTWILTAYYRAYEGGGNRAGFTTCEAYCF